MQAAGSMHSTSGLRRRTKSLRVSLQYLMSTKSPHGGTRRADSSRTSYGHLLHTVLSCATESITPAAQLEHAVRAPGAPPRICCPYIALHAHTECDPRALFLTCARATRKPHLCRQACDTVTRTLGTTRTNSAARTQLCRPAPGAGPAAGASLGASFGPAPTRVPARRRVADPKRFGRRTLCNLRRPRGGSDFRRLPRGPHRLLVAELCAGACGPPVMFTRLPHPLKHHHRPRPGPALTREDPTALPSRARPPGMAAIAWAENLCRVRDCDS